MPLGEPPANLDGFPSIPGPQPLYRVHRRANGPIYFSNGGDGRFDLPAPRGTLYCAETPVGAIIEVFRTPLIAIVEVHARQLSVLATGRPIMIATNTETDCTGIKPEDRLRLADCTNPAARAFGVTAAIHGSPDYALCQRWALAFANAGFDGIYYLASHDPSSSEHSIALFQNGPHMGNLHQAVIAPIQDDLLAEVEDRFGMVAVPTPRSTSGLGVEP